MVGWLRCLLYISHLLHTFECRNGVWLSSIHTYTFQIVLLILTKRIDRRFFVFTRCNVDPGLRIHNQFCSKKGEALFLFIYVFFFLVFLLYSTSSSPRDRHSPLFPPSLLPSCDTISSSRGLPNLHHPSSRSCNKKDNRLIIVGFSFLLPLAFFSLLWPSFRQAGPR